MKRERIQTIAYWATTVFGPASFIIGGIIGLSRDAESLKTLSHLGYPGYFSTILGAWKLLGAIAIVAPGYPRLKEWAYAGFFFDLTSAAISHAFVGDGVGDILAPLGFLALVAASWALRPESRKLPSTREGSFESASPTVSVSAIGARA
jgi:uncharacterized membrane protein YphA (DoxX/SURF4 family)